MDLRQLEYVVAVAEHGSFTSAARAVHVSQPSLSTGVRALETELGVELFTRLGRSSEPTIAGKEVVECARQVLRDMAELTSVVAAVTELRTGTLDLVALPTLAVDPVARLVGLFRSQHPGIMIRVHEPEDAADLERAVRSGRAEVGVCDITTGGAGLTRIELFRQEIVVVLPPGSDLPEGPVTPRVLAGLPLVVTPVGTSIRRVLDRALEREGRAPTIAVEMASREAVVHLVLAGAGAALLPRSLADEAARRGAGLRALQPGLGRRVGLLHRGTHLSPAARGFIDLAQSS